MLSRLTADDKEGCAGVILAQYVEDAGSPAGVGPVVERQGRRSLPQRRLSQLDPGRQIQIALIYHPTVCRVHGDCAVPNLLEPGDPGDLSLAAQCGAEADHRQRGRDGAVSRSQNLPQPLVLQTHPPQAHASEAKGLSLAYERLLARSVAEPDGVACVIRARVGVPGLPRGRVP